MRAPFLAGCALLFLVAFVEAERAQSSSPALPPISLTCPHHPDVIESKPGTCPFCKMTLVPVRLAPAWTCPLHPSTIADKAGSCPICRRQLVPVTVSVSWTCKGSKDEHVERGTCPDGSAMTLTRTLRPHGDHNPRHGGQFFMASDNWHHVEGAYPSARAFRLYVYDDFARPLPKDRLSAVRAQVFSERFDPATKKTIAGKAVPLRVTANGAYLEARVEPSSLPANLTAKVQFTSGSAEQRFDFTFMQLTREPAAPTATANARASNPKTAPSPKPARPDATGAASAAVAAPAPAAEPDPALIPLPIPETVPEILAQLKTRNQQIAGLIDRGDFGAVWVPAFQAKDLAIALEERLTSLDPSRREAASPAIQRLVRLSWLLDAHGDTGNRQNVTTAYGAFSAAVGDVLGLFADPPR